MLIQKLLNRHRISDYYLANRLNYSGGIGQTLIRCEGDEVYDVLYGRHINQYVVMNPKKLTDYIECDKKYITDRYAKRLAESCYREFYADYLKEQNFEQN